MKNVFVPTENGKQTQQLIEDLLRMKPRLGTVIGSTGRGKSTVIQQIAVHNSETVYISFSEAMTTPTAVFREVAFALTGELRCRSYSGLKCFSIIKASLAEHPRALLVDEADRLSVRQMNALRDISDHCAVPIILVGEEELTRRLSMERRLMSRVVRSVRFKPVQDADVSCFYEQSMGLKLTHKQVKSLVSHSEGDFRLVVNDAEEIERMMRLSGLDRVSDKLIEEVCRANRYGG